MIWCPYTDTEIDVASASPEHIIPLSLGGSNGFTIPVEAQFNSEVGGQVDGAVANDFLTLVRRTKFDARGHSKKAPVATIRNARIGPEARPAQVTFGSEAITVWDAKLGRNLERAEYADKRVQMKIAAEKVPRFRYLAKVALSSGYFIYGDLFRQHVAHADLRALMLSETTEAMISVLQNSSLRGYYEFAGFNEVDAKDSEMVKFVCENVPGSCVYTTLTDASIIFFIGILGKWVGTLNVPADVSAFPKDGEHDLGHAVVLIDRATRRCSNRQFHREIFVNAFGADSLPPEDVGGD
ncbi:hypothetical protein [Variovorax paradoxus]|uniref:hypothetical protein n=1 Tax=Variovorax paradoxus TaxID=34073 RepID=UPI003ED02EE5